MSIESLLSEIDSWYNDSAGREPRPSLLSKLAVLELCGWLEQRLDELVHASATICGMHEVKRVLEAVDKTYGFGYHDHFRKMLVNVIGEKGMTACELLLEASHPGDLDLLKSALGDLLIVRGVLAHTSSSTPVKRQITLQAPSWAINQQRILSRRIDRLEAAISSITTRIHAAV